MKIHFILVEPAVPENIGAAARAIKTMGFDSLILVNPPGYPQKKMYHVAHGSHDILDNVKLSGTLQEALVGMDLAIASTARRRSVKHDYHHAGALPAILSGKNRALRNVALVFGREESGLTNTETGLCDLISSIPMKRKYPSLNLSQAVMLYAYLLSDFSNVRKVNRKSPVTGKFSRMKSMAEEVLRDTGVAGNTNMSNRILERIALLCDADVDLLLSVLKRLARKLRTGQS